jgi:MEMO1 family protein
MRDFYILLLSLSFVNGNDYTFSKVRCVMMAILAAFILPHPPLIIPAVGKGEERKIQKTIDAYDQAAREIAALHPDTILVTTPHSVIYSDYLHISPGEKAHGDFTQFGVSGSAAEFQYDPEFVGALTQSAKRAKLPAGTFGERDSHIDHGTLVPLSFVNKYYRNYKLVRCSISGLGAAVHYHFGKCIAETAEALGRRTVLIASGDLSHKLKDDGPYGFAAEGPEFDRQVTEAMASGDFMRFLTFEEDFCDAAAECGLRSFQIMSGAFDGLSVKPEFLSYEGPFGVCYAVCGFYPGEKEETRHLDVQLAVTRREKLAEGKRSEDEFVRLARLSLETYLKERKYVKTPAALPEEMTAKRAGVFVSLKKDGRLRGCIGTIEATQDCIAEEIIHNAVSAGTRDPRFDAVTEEELGELVYSVDVLGDSEPIASVAELDVKRYGVIVTMDSRCGLLLPNLSGVDTPEQQVKIALQKGGISSTEQFSMERFEVVRHK